MTRPSRPPATPKPSKRPSAKPSAGASASPAAGAEKPTATSGDDAGRIAKVLARAGIASRRDAEKLIAEGRVAVNGKVITSPALDVTGKDRITIDGKPLPAAEPPRLWLYHKPEGLVTTTRDEQGRATIFDHLPPELPRVMSIGRLDLNSEGLLLLTNDGALKRRLELPSTGWLRRYRVRVNGRPEDTQFDSLRKGITVDGEQFQAMTVTLDRQQGANAWLTVGLREGRNREVRRAMEAIGLTVNRLIRLSYGPFQLGDLPPGGVEEVRPRVLKDQLGLTELPVPQGSGAAAGGRAPTSGRGKPASERRAATGAAPSAKAAAPSGTSSARAKGARGLAASVDAFVDRIERPAKAGPARTSRKDGPGDGPGDGTKPARKPGAKPGTRSGLGAGPGTRPKSDPRSGTSPRSGSGPGGRGPSKPRG